MNPSTGAHLGNFPQTLTHAALIQAALALRDRGPTGPQKIIGGEVRSRQGAKDPDPT